MVDATAPAPGAPERLVRTVDRLAAEAQGRCSGAALDAITAVRDRLAEPMRTAVIGRVSSGKSTLVNALLGAGIATTSAGECTAVPCWFRHGQWTTAVARTRSGETVPVPLPGGVLPVDLPLPLPEVDRIEVTLPVPLLRTMTLIDTPGLASAAALGDASTAAAATESTIVTADLADAVVLVVNGALKQDEASTIATFQARAATDPLAAGTAIAAVTKSDQLADRASTTGVAAAVAEQMAVTHRTLLSTVVPVIGLLGETGSTARLDEHDVRALQALGRDWDGPTLELALTDHRLFAELPGPVEPERRTRLLRLVGLFGLGELLDAVRSGRAGSAAQLCDLALELSGTTALRRALDDLVGRRADVLKASTALQAMADAATLPGASSWLADRVQALSDDDVMFPVRLLTASTWVASGRVRPPEQLEQEIAAAAVGRLGPADRALAAERAGVWRTWRMFADGRGQHTADVMVRAWQDVARGVR